MSQVAAKTKMEIRNERVKVTAHFYEAGSVLRGDAFGEARRFEIELSMESDAPVEQVKKLMTLAHRMCFTEAALQGGVEISSENRLNGEPLPLE